MVRRTTFTLVAASIWFLAVVAAAESRSPGPKRTDEAVTQQRQLQHEKERAFALASGEQSGTVKRLSVGKLYIEPYNPTSDLTAFLVPQITPIYQGNEKVTSDALVPGTSVRIHFRFSPVLDQPARAIAIEILSVTESRAAKMAALQSPAVMNEGRGLIPAVPPPGKAEILADASGSLVGRIDRLNDSSVLLTEQTGREQKKLRLDPYVSVFQGPFRVGTDKLEAGSEVRVYYREQRGAETPLVIAVDLLQPTTPDARPRN